MEEKPEFHEMFQEAVDAWLAASRPAMARALRSWIAERALKDDKRVDVLLQGVDAFVAGLQVDFTPEGELDLVAPASRDRLILERGSTWFAGGDWKFPILAAVSSLTKPTFSNQP